MRKLNKFAPSVDGLETRKLMTLPAGSLPPGTITGAAGGVVTGVGTVAMPSVVIDDHMYRYPPIQATVPDGNGGFRVPTPEEQAGLPTGPDGKVIFGPGTTAPDTFPKTPYDN